MVLVRNSDGYRVVRGPNWKHNDEDEGEGHVGTIQSTDSWDHKVEVEWKSRVVYNPESVCDDYPITRETIRNIEPQMSEDENREDGSVTHDAEDADDVEDAEDAEDAEESVNADDAEATEDVEDNEDVEEQGDIEEQSDISEHPDVDFLFEDQQLLLSIVNNYVDDEDLGIPWKDELELCKSQENALPLVTKELFEAQQMLLEATVNAIDEQDEVNSINETEGTVEDVTDTCSVLGSPRIDALDNEGADEEQCSSELDNEGADEEQCSSELDNEGADEEQCSSEIDNEVPMSEVEEEETQSSYEAGGPPTRQYELRIFDLSAIHLYTGHLNVPCNSCFTQSIFGYRWKCFDCDDYNLCTTCYMSGDHNTCHHFIRYDGPLHCGILVSQRCTARKVDALDVICEDWWGERKSENQQLTYYPDHLAILGLDDASEQWHASEFAQGDKVKVKVTPDEYKELQPGDVSEAMLENIESIGIVLHIDAKGNLMVQYEECDRPWTINSNALEHHTRCCCRDSPDESSKTSDVDSTCTSSDIDDIDPSPSTTTNTTLVPRLPLHWDSGGTIKFEISIASVRSAIQQEILSALPTPNSDGIMRGNQLPHVIPVITSSNSNKRQKKKKKKEKKLSPNVDGVPDEVKKELEMLREKTKLAECVICMDRSINIIFQCGHGSCVSCSTRLVECHVCRTVIRSTTKTFC